MDAEQILEIVHEVGILGTMALFVYGGAQLMLQYSATADILGLAAGLVLMITGAVVIGRSPARYRKRHAAQLPKVRVRADEDELDAAGISR